MSASARAYQNRNRETGRLSPLDQDQIDLGLAVLCSIQRPGQIFSHRAIGAAIGASRGYVFLLERQALKKIRERLRKEHRQNFGVFYGAQSMEEKL